MISALDFFARKGVDLGVRPHRITRLERSGDHASSTLPRDARCFSSVLAVGIA
jgi:hypothetical protein